MSVRIGNEVGYSVRFDQKESNLTRIKYMTDGMILREALLDSNLSKVDILILDEIHERSLNSDNLLALAKLLSKKRSNFKLIVMSATLDLKQLTSYLETQKVLNIEGRSFPIEIYNLKTDKGEMIVTE